MDLFARCFLLIFAQLYVGGMLALAIPPFHQLERGFYKSTSGVYLGFGLAALAGRITLMFGRPWDQIRWGLDLPELAFWTVSVIAAAVYFRELWGENFRRRALAFSCSWISGCLALVIAAQWYRLGPAISLETILYPLSFVISALLLGAVSTGMLLGHWYLIDHDLSIDPFRQMLRFYIAMLIIQAGSWAVTALLLLVLGSDPATAAASQLAGEHSALLLLRVMLSPVAAAGLAWMIWRTLQIPQTMAATGLFYVAILAVFVGELMGRFILFRTQLPL